MQKIKILLTVLFGLLILTGCTAVRRTFHYSEPSIYSYPCTEHDSCKVYNINFHLRY